MINGIKYTYEKLRDSTQFQIDVGDTGGQQENQRKSVSLPSSPISEKNKEPEFQDPKPSHIIVKQADEGKNSADIVGRQKTPSSKEVGKKATVVANRGTTTKQGGSEYRTRSGSKSSVSSV